MHTLQHSVQDNLDICSSTLLKDVVLSLFSLTLFFAQLRGVKYFIIPANHRLERLMASGEDSVRSPPSLFLPAACADLECLSLGKEGKFRTVILQVLPCLLRSLPAGRPDNRKWVSVRDKMERHPGEKVINRPFMLQWDTPSHKSKHNVIISHYRHHVVNGRRIIFKVN